MTNVSCGLKKHFLILSVGSGLGELCGYDILCSSVGGEGNRT